MTNPPIHPSLHALPVNPPVPPGMSTGLIPRNYDSHPVGCYSFAPEFPASELIDESEWADRLNENRKNKSGLLDLRENNFNYLKSLGQDGFGLCWAFSSTKATMYVRKIQNQSEVILSAWYVAGVIKGWRDEGGWGAASLEQIVKAGVPAESFCPDYHKPSDMAAAEANALLHRVTEWWDGSDDPAIATKQCVSMLLKGIPCVVDLNSMSHSMACIDIKSLNPLTLVYDNSWLGNDEPGKGLYIGTGARARPDGLVCPRVTLPSVV